MFIFCAIVLSIITLCGGLVFFANRHRSASPSSGNFCRQLLGAMVEPIIVIAETGNIIYANPAAGSLFGYPTRELFKKKAADLLVLHEGQDLLPLFRQCILADDRRARAQHELRGRAQDGSAFPVRLRISEFSHHRSRAFVLVLHDILGEHLVELELRRYAEQLHQAKNSLQSQNRNLELIVKERTAELAQAKDAAELANRSKTEFVNLVSHELRSPLHGILSFAELGSDRTATLERPKLQEYFGTITRCGNMLLALVNDLLDLSKIESGLIVLKTMTTNLVELVRGVISEYEALLKSKEITILLNRTSEEIFIDANPEKIGQVVRNLLSNAVKFAPDNSQIDIAIVQGCAGVMFSIRDEGPGIPEPDLPHVFDKFYQATNGQHKSGTGLGLAICKQLIELHHGEISARNAQLGGAILSFTLPAVSQPDSFQSAQKESTCAI